MCCGNVLYSEGPALKMLANPLLKTRSKHWQEVAAASVGLVTEYHSGNERKHRVTGTFQFRLRHSGVLTVDPVQ